ncbi:hypothetical protein K437DRAFT_90493 [Tilletiaria anomala UBC 951]|uniref:Uncharacterized protein n=1 Tax=Tilletiaria anomala (strain ATCC 24038 / CBS 436.72 / UBC 951) TaxID=1037660 RepID=A0A066W610_TILAU|nr:uncharacterized protein K437DRAFT_90493 [Tilletiaria anomala UBC 951]KDN47973.1 hypothetical protein K437DRAFT_90493 [Tilletiaria anomala UBC 951]
MRMDLRDAHLPRHLDIYNSGALNPPTPKNGSRHRLTQSTSVPCSAPTSSCKRAIGTKRAASAESNSKCQKTMQSKWLFGSSWISYIRSSHRNYAHYPFFRAISSVSLRVARLKRRAVTSRWLLHESIKHARG